MLSKNINIKSFMILWFYDFIFLWFMIFHKTQFFYVVINIIINLII